jgi:peptide/nickel transport system substrate-binding protein
MAQRTRFLGFLLALSMVGSLALTACSGNSTAPPTSPGGQVAPSNPAAPAAGPTKGGILKVATIGEPPGLDYMFTGAAISRDISNHVWEGLTALDDNSQVNPMLAERIDVAADGKSITFFLRKGVLFHNGKELTSEDVVPSVQRWLKIASFGKTLAKDVESVVATDKYEVVINLKQPIGPLLFGLAGTAHIHPKEILDKFGETKITEHVGTGPYKVLDHQPDRHVKLGRWEKYTPRTEPGNGKAGAMNAYLDEIWFIPTPDGTTRLNLLETGDVHIDYSTSGTQLNKLRSMANVEPWIVRPWSYLITHMNNQQGPMTNKFLRQAMLAALDMEPIMLAAYGDKSMYRLSPGIMQPENGDWYSDAGKAVYNKQDLNRVKDLLQKAGYNGEVIRHYTTKEYQHMYNGAVVAEEMWKKAGINLELKVVDWATLTQIRAKPGEWDIFTSANGTGDEPVSHVILQPSWHGWYTNPAHVELMDKLNSEMDQTKRQKEIYQKIEELFWEEVPHIKYGDAFGLKAHLNTVKGMPATVFHLSNVWLEKK